uniref:Serpentine receptor class gamma n=2 Tax=Caenorhabditis tropicalis TaxID=1561998 RepID=A0A1I7U7U9_9PELO
MIPFVLMYIPAAMVFIFPMLSIELNFKYPIITHAVAIYPAIDPLPTILIIKSYRRGLIELFQMLACRGKFQVKGLSNWKNNTINPVSFTASS